MRLFSKRSQGFLSSLCLWSPFASVTISDTLFVFLKLCKTLVCNHFYIQLPKAFWNFSSNESWKWPRIFSQFSACGIPLLWKPLLHFSAWFLFTHHLLGCGSRRDTSTLSAAAEGKRELRRLASDHHLVFPYATFLVLGRVMSPPCRFFQGPYYFLLLLIPPYSASLHDSLILGHVLGTHTCEPKTQLQPR